MQLIQLQILTQNLHQTNDRRNKNEGSAVANHRRFANFKVGDAKIGIAVGVELIHIVSDTRNEREERNGQLKGIKHQIFILDQHTQSKLGIDPATLESVDIIANHAARISKIGTKSKTN